MLAILEKLLPTFISISLLLAITLLKDRSKAIASVLAIAPVNIVLALIILYGKFNGDSHALAPVLRNMAVGILGTLLWLVTAFLILRAGITLWVAIPAGYAVFACWVWLVWRMGWFIN
jgi:hypothetical protein